MLDHPQLQAATARVVADGQTYGTAWLAGQGLLLTAAHVVGDLELQQILSSEVTLVFPGDKKVIATACAADTDFVLDIALLRIHRHGERLDEVAPIPIADPKAGHWPEDDRWQAWGFPAGHSAGLFMDGTIVSLHGQVAEGVPAIQMRSEQKPYEDLRNASGSAVIANGVAIGLIRKFTPNMAEGAVFAAPLGEARGKLPDLTPWLLLGRRGLVVAELEKKRAQETAVSRIVKTGDGGVAIGGDHHGNLTINNK